MDDRDGVRAVVFARGGTGLLGTAVLVSLSAVSWLVASLAGGVEGWQVPGWLAAGHRDGRTPWAG
ncbi:hypothetical protein BL253_25200 [Pseudofrankia asymbiotica]|uniref:Uncharacterized protein n=1 Tax=Pseudofrankia asymbiotica TaxID=1834516 RepID=A0A1V2I686_9ACTN|nr:hypothetical protein BL253_25200 [Pseudofrankia asymbiotica]